MRRISVYGQPQAKKVHKALSQPIARLALACYPSYTGVSDWEHHSSRLAQAKKFMRSLSQQKNLSVMAYSFHPSYGEHK
jgi:hypothetical protein